MENVLQQPLANQAKMRLLEFKDQEHPLRIILQHLLPQTASPQSQPHLLQPSLNKTTLILTPLEVNLLTVALFLGRGQEILVKMGFLV